MKRIFLIYHKEDNDGLFSAAIAKTWIMNEYIGCELSTLGTDYASLGTLNKKTINEWKNKYDTVIMTDISFSDPKMMKAMYNVFGNEFIWIDHHAPAIKSSDDYGYSSVPGERETTRSAILLAYKFFYDPLDIALQEKRVPEIFNVLSAYDSWSWKLHKLSFDYVRDVNRGVTFYYKLNLNSIYAFVLNIIKNGENAGDVTYLLELGHTINKAEDEENKELLKSYGDYSWKVGMETAVAIFSQKPTNSIMFKSAEDKVQHGIVFKRKPDGQWVVSLYNVTDDAPFDCGAYMKAIYGGGGHKGAAGATLSEEKFIEVLKTKSL